LQNFPELTYAPIRINPLNGEQPCGPATNYGACDGVRFTVRLHGAPAGTYTAELLGGGIDPAPGNGTYKRFLPTGTRTVTGSGDLDFVLDLRVNYDIAVAALNFIRAGIAEQLFL